MGEILRNWLHLQLGVKVNFDPIYLGKTFQDGVLFKQILNNYGIISDSHSMSISHNTDFKTCQQNLRQLCVWFNLLNINFNEKSITEIANGQCSTIIRLLYEMFLCFENKQHLYFVTKQSQRNIKQSIQSRFQLGNVTETTLDEDNTLSLERPIVENKGIIEWYKEKFSLLKEKLKTSHTEHLCNTDLKGTHLNQEMQTKNKWQTQDNNLTPVSDLDDYSQFLLMDNEKSFKEHLPSVVLPKEEYLSMLRLNKHKNAVKKCLAKKMQNTLLNSVWHQIHDSHEREFNDLFSKLLTKQSQYEKQIVMKLSQEHESNTLQIPPEILVEKEKEHLCNLQIRDEFEKGKEMYEDEKHRILELHHRLYAEKQQKKAEESYNICAEVIDSIINISFRVSEFKKINNEPVPESEWNDWKQLFFKSLDIPDGFVEQIINDDDNEDGTSVGIISLIQDYDDILNEHSLYEYLYFVGTWFAEELCPELDSPNEDEQIVLGYVVHRLLELKYPYPPSPKPVELPPMALAVMIQGMHDSTAIKKLKMLLTKSEISVLEIDDVLKCSIDTYKNETNDPNTEKTKKHDKTSKKSLKSKSTKKSKDKGLPKKEKKTNNEKRMSKSKAKKGSKSSKKSEPEKENSGDNLDNDNIETTLENEKRTQTPAVLPEDDGSPKRTDFGLIGEQVFNVLNSGIPVSDSLLVSTLIEYLKTQISIKGWILINFPDSIVQASLLELALTGREIPNVEVGKSRNSQNEVLEKNELETMDELRFSKLVPYPSEIHKLEDFKTYFNSVIYTKVKTLEETEILLEEVSNTTVSTSAIVEEDAVLLSVESFYKTQDGFYEYYYDQLDLNNLKQLARYILAETDTERKSSVELFGEDILKALTVKSSSKKKASKSEGKKQKPKKSLKKSVKRNEESEILKSEEAEIICLDEPILENNETEKLLKDDIDELILVEPLKPGDSGWNYSQFDVPNTLAIALATQWESFETSYLQNLKQQFFNKRILFSRLVPYKNFVSKTIRSLIEQSDNKQNLVTEFQEFYNSIDEHLLLFVEMKNEMHCKVFELQNKLWSICDERKASTAQKLKEIIKDNWVPIEMCALTNVYLSLVQLELNRFINTLNLLNDYYTLMLGRIPSDHKDYLSISTLDLNLLKENNSESIESITYAINQTYKTNNIFDYISKLLNNTIITEDLVNPFCFLLEKNIDKALENITNIGSKFGDGIRKEENLSMPPKQKSHKSPPKIKIQKNTKLKKNSKTNKTYDESITTLPNNPLDESDNLKRNMFDEWKFVLENEVKRVKYKCDLIKCRGILDLTDFLSEIVLTFHNLLNEIIERYFLDIETVDNICKIISTAIEEETTIPQKLIISDAKLFVTKQISSEQLVWPKELLEEKYKYVLTSEQATFLMEDLKTAAPWGFISKIPLVYILEDILLRDMHENMKRLPDIWNDLEPKELKEIVDTIFGNVSLVDWRDLIVCCLNIPFPTIEELLTTQKECKNNDPYENETLDFETFTNIKFWFEKELSECPEERLKFVNIKNLLYNLFEDESNNVNYPALLLSFCKDIEPGVGFGKALALAVHKRIILCESDLYLERFSICSHNAETYQVVTNIVSGLINMVLISTECPVITEVEDGDIVISEFSSSLDEHKLAKSQTSENFDRTTDIFKSVISTSTISKHSSKGSQKSCSSEQKSQAHESVIQNTSSHSAKSELCCVSICSTAEEYWGFISQVPVETILTVIVTSMIPRNNSLNIQQTLDELTELSVDGNIPVHLLLDLPCMTDLFSNSQKFNLHVMHEIILEIIQKRSVINKN